MKLYIKCSVYVNSLIKKKQKIEKEKMLGNMSIDKGNYRKNVICNRSLI